MNLFGRKKAEPPPPPTSNAGPTVSASSTLNAITKLRDAGDTLDKREDYLNNKIKKETDEAKKFMGQGKKSQARASPLGPACLPSRPGRVGEAAGRSQGRVGRRLAAPPPDARALSGRQALQCIKRKKMYEGQVEKIGQARLNLETQQLALEQLNLNKEVVEAQREGAKTMASVTAQMGAIEDAQADANDIAEALGRPMAGAYDMDDSDLLAELEELESEDLESQEKRRALYRSPEVRASPEPLLGPTQALGVDLSELKGLDAPSVPSSKPMPSAPTGKVRAPRAALSRRSLPHAPLL
ncbi:vacuolar protein sorting protein 32 [Emiliania huxleyi CCMP1516]|uniref:Uncharacterized protein n=2 Tax=Emiliania huxleyi TaxID=2903 RepID=A0A0D3KWJ8_EMIH1|nr:vacuolar protein sorting protein 32 [Emiliania huxleyi CCMP1516]EOD40133.1 vacuolar protein sorting protein 32 [Emiliania huxleyi CCMP1516]|eukprot:XP_005792562.1 vacuolar protein sorting protein 32 [Emiliania huxleyi CCMP1516]